MSITSKSEYYKFTLSNMEAFLDLHGNEIDMLLDVMLGYN